jgi:hypothetical protein
LKANGEIDEEFGENAVDKAKNEAQEVKNKVFNII